VPTADVLLRVVRPPKKILLFLGPRRRGVDRLPFRLLNHSFFWNKQTLRAVAPPSSDPEPGPPLSYVTAIRGRAGDEVFFALPLIFQDKV